MVDTSIFQIIDIEESSCSNMGMIIYAREVGSQVGTILELKKKLFCARHCSAA